MAYTKKTATTGSTDKVTNTTDFREDVQTFSP